MSSALDVGVAPAFCWVPPHASTAGSEVVGLAESVGRYPYAAQRLVLDAMFAEHPDGSNVAFEFGLVCCRQNLKTWCLEVAVLADLFLHAEPLVVWTAQQLDTTKETFVRFKDLIERHSHLERRVRQVVETNGEWEISLTSGARVKFKARSQGAGRGLTGSKVILDEAYALTPSSMGDLLPTMLTVPDAQVRYASSAGKAASSVLRGIRDRGRAGGSPSLSYLEWCDMRPPACATPGCDHTYGIEGCSADDQRRWPPANPGMGVLIDEPRVQALREALPGEEFVRECLGWWEEPSGDVDEPPISADAWSLLADGSSTIASGIACAVDVSPDRSMSAVCFAGIRVDGRRHVELAAHGRGTGWAVEWLTTRHARWGMPVRLNPSGPAGALIADLERAGVPLELVSEREYRQACGALLDAVEAGTLRHRGQPELDDAVAAGRKRSVGEAFGWNRRDITADITPLVAATIAVHGVRSFDISTQIY